MGVRESFINARSPSTCTQDPKQSSSEEEYYKWRVRDLKRRIRDVRKKIAKLKNIMGHAA